ncbi:hypothetical protein A4G28_00665 [Mycobacterium ostraviense]|uniref:Lon proteolytic domain-containing protein n=1 Tax=Mycobacterium ostraviense TaxID=2738409 RepID=A0A168F184_9MYCO|nr:hypothetical protein A4G28_00665 [Mycobacterium ostraviense]
MSVPVLFTGTIVLPGMVVRFDVGMTGEVTLNGRVLPIGGVKKELLAAQRAGLSTALFRHATNRTSTMCLLKCSKRSTTDVTGIVAQGLEAAAARYCWSVH